MRKEEKQLEKLKKELDFLYLYPLAHPSKIEKLENEIKLKECKFIDNHKLCRYNCQLTENRGVCDRNTKCKNYKPKL